MATSKRGEFTTVGEFGEQIPYKLGTFSIAAAGGDFTSLAEIISGRRYFDNDILDFTDASLPSNFADFAFIKGLVNLRGDTRPLAGHGYLDGAKIFSGAAGAGTLIIALSNSALTLTVGTSGVAPDFAGWVSGDKLKVIDNSGVITEVTIASVAANVFTLTATAPTVGGRGSSVVLIPNKQIVNGAALFDLNGYYPLHIEVTGLHIKSTASAILVTSLGDKQSVNFTNCVFEGGQLRVTSSARTKITNCSFVSSGTSNILLDLQGNMDFVDLSA